jgi:hypothetical protein
MKNETPFANTFRPFRAGRRMGVFLGLTPQAESFCPFFGAETECSASLSVSVYGPNPGLDPFAAFGTITDRSLC